MATILNNLAGLLWALGDSAGARPLYERARRLQLAVAAANVELDDEALRGVVGSAVQALRPYAGLLAAIAREPARDRTAATPAADAFLVAEQARGQSAQRALSRAGACAAAGDAATANLARQVQDLRDRRDDPQTARHRIRAPGGTAEPDANRDASTVHGEPRSRSDGGRDTATRGLPAVRRTRVTRADRRICGAAAATTDEALVRVFALEDRVLVWVLRGGRVLVYRDIEVKRKDLQALVAQVRSSMDQSVNRELAAGRLVPFDIAAAHALYQLLLAPVAAEFVGVKHLIVVPDETLLPVPFGVLVTKTDGDAYRRAF